MSIESPPPTPKLQSLQMLRGWAALLVVIFHAAAIWRSHSGASGFAGPWDRGWAGVDLFFVISGFVMVWVAVDRSSGIRTTLRFLFDRATRIYPLWWAFCLIMAAYFWFTYGQPASPDKVGPDGALGILIKSLALWPMGDQPVLGVGWTLTFELAFYALFAVLLFFPSRWRVPLIALWGAALIARWIIAPAGNGLPFTWLEVIANPLCLEFVAGALVAWVLRHWTPSVIGARILIVIGIFTFLFLLWAGPVMGSETLMHDRVLTFGVASTVLMLGIVGREMAGGFNVPSIMSRLGDISYTLYLSHFIGLLVIARVFEMLGLFTTATPLSMTAFIVIGTFASIIGAEISYRLLERPLLTLSRALWPKPKVSPT